MPAGPEFNLNGAFAHSAPRSSVVGHDIHYASLGEVSEALATKQVSSAELVAAAIDRIERVDPAINTIVCRDFAHARQAALAADAMLARGERGPLLGIPITFKESFRVRGLPTSWGLAACRNWTADSESEVVTRLGAVGAVILGKTNIATALADWQAYNAVYGTTNNPYDVDCTAGGSSGGAAAVAAGFTYLDVGSDLLGSIRIPAHFCGVYGLRPSAGRVSRKGYAFPGTHLPNELSEIGPITRSAGDLALALRALAADCMPGPERRGLRGLRVLLLDTHPLTPTSCAIRTAVRACGDTLAAAGAELTEDAGGLIDLAEEARLFFRLMGPSNAARVSDADYARLVDQTASIEADDSLAAFAIRAWTAPPRDWMRARELALLRRLAWDHLFTRIDMVICPVSPTVAFPHDHGPYEQRKLIVDGETAPYFDQACWSTSASLCGFPAATFPWTREQGLPIGLQAIGPHGGDETLVHILGRLEEITGGFCPPPC